MSCQRVSTDGVVERYLLGDLSEAEREAFEEHYFECDECFAELEALGAIRDHLEEEQNRTPRLAMQPRARTRWWWWALAAAVVVTILVAVGLLVAS